MAPKYGVKLFGSVYCQARLCYFEKEVISYLEWARFQNLFAGEGTFKGHVGTTGWLVLTYKCEQKLKKIYYIKCFWTQLQVYIVLFLIYISMCYRLGSYDALNSDDSQSLSLSQSQEIPLSQSSNWSTKSENKSSILKIKTEQKAQDVQKIRDLFQDLGYSFPDSLNAALDPNVRPILQHL